MFPLLQDLKTYTRDLAWRDLVASLTVSVVLIPQSMAYAMLGGMPAVYGLYTSLIPLLVFGFFTTSRTLSIGPVALVSIVLLSGLSTYATPLSEAYLQLIILTGIIAGAIQIAASFLKLGSLANKISQPVIGGFVSAAGLTIAISQIKYFFALDVSGGSSVFAILKNSLLAMDGANFQAFLIGLIGVATILIIKKINKKIPSQLIAIIVGIAIYLVFEMSKYNVPHIGEIPSGLPSFDIAFLQSNGWIKALPTALVLALVCFLCSYSVAVTLDEKKEGPNVNADKELFGLGIAKVVGSFFMAAPSSASFSRSAINFESGARTGMASIFAAVIVGLTLLFCGFAFYYLPVSILAAIVVTSVTSLIKHKEPAMYFKCDKWKFTLWMVTFGATLSLGIIQGISIGIIIDLIAKIFFGKQ